MVLLVEQCGSIDLFSVDKCQILYASILARQSGLPKSLMCSAYGQLVGPSKSYTCACCPALI